jgi:sulfur transfer protein SufE
VHSARLSLSDRSPAQAADQIEFRITADAVVVSGLQIVLARRVSGDIGPIDLELLGVALG